MESVITAVTYFGVILWGWPGAVLAILAAIELAQRMLRRRLVRAFWLQGSAALVIALGIWATWCYLAVPDARDFPDLNEIIDAGRLQRRNDDGIDRIIANLRWELVQNR
jgi:hypothetical protein